MDPGSNRDDSLSELLRLSPPVPNNSRTLAVAAAALLANAAAREQHAATANSDASEVSLNGDVEMGATVDKQAPKAVASTVSPQVPAAAPSAVPKITKRPTLAPTPASTSTTPTMVTTTLLKTGSASLSMMPASPVRTSLSATSTASKTHTRARPMPGAPAPVPAATTSATPVTAPASAASAASAAPAASAVSAVSAIDHPHPMMQLPLYWDLFHTAEPMRQSNATCVYTHCYLTCEVPVGGAWVSLDADADVAMASSIRTPVRPCAFVPREVHTIALHLDTGRLELRGSLEAPFRFLAPLTLFTHSARSYLPATAAASSIVREDIMFRITKQCIKEAEERARKLQAELEATKQELERMKQQSQLMYSFEERREVQQSSKEASPKAPKRESNRKRLRRMLASDDDDDDVDNGEVGQVEVSKMSDEEEEDTEKKEKQEEEAEAENKATARTTQANARVKAHATQSTPATETEAGGEISLTKVLAMANAVGINIRDPNIEAARRRRKTSKVKFYLGLIQKKERADCHWVGNERGCEQR